MKTNISQLMACLGKEEELLIEFQPHHIELTIARTDARLNGEAVYVTRYISLEELCASPIDLLKVTFEYTLDTFRRGCQELGLQVPHRWFKIPTQAELEAVKGHKFLNEIHNQPPKARDYLNQGKPPRPKKLPPPPPQEIKRD